MAIDRIGSNPVSFRGFYADTKSAYILASEFIGKPELERKFMHNIFKPLSETKLYDVFVNGGTPAIISKDSNNIMTVLLPGSTTDHTLGVVWDNALFARNNLRRISAMIPTSNFKNDGYLLHVIEAAKNIVMDREAAATKNALKDYASIATESVEEKAARLRNIFGNRN